MKKIYSLCFKKRGATLIELMLATAIFGFLTIALLAILQYGTKSWRQVESRFQAEKDVRKVVLDINNSLRNSDITTFNTDGKSWMAFKTSNNYEPGNKILENDFKFDSNGKVVWTFFAFYYLYDPSMGGGKCEKCNKLNFTGMDCPHKVLAKKWLWIKNPDASGAVETDLPLFARNFEGYDKEITHLETTVVSSKTGKIPDIAVEPNPAKDKPVPKILAQNIMNFTVAFSIEEDPNVSGRNGAGNGGKPNTVQYTVRAFKELEASEAKINGATISPETLASRKFTARFTMQIDQGVAPLNNFADVSSP